jgi:hypothetical protein
MMTQASLSAATPAQSHPCTLHGNLGRPLRLTARGSRPAQFLIANPRLTVRVNPIRICDLKISNRKFSTIFHHAWPASHQVPLVTSHLSLATAFLIETPRLEILISPILSASSNFLIETKVAFSVNPTTKTRIQCGREGESA